MKERFSKYIKENDNIIQLSVGKINLIKKIGEGGNGIVYKGEIFEKTFAFKFLLSNASGKTLNTKTERFLAEYFNIITIQSSFIVKYVDYDLLTITDLKGSLTIPVIMMKEYESSLKHDESQNKNKSFTNLFNFLIDSVEQIHNEGIIHRDLKPENILVKNGEYVLADFGIANYNPDIFKIRANTKKSERIGNRLFSAPEQENSEVSPDLTMDIYAIGQILQWYAVGETHRGTGRKKISLDIDDNIVYDRIIDKCLSNNPKNRFQQISEIRKYLKDSKKKDIFDNMYDFSELLRSNFPKNMNNFVNSKNTKRIDSLLQSIYEKEKTFDKQIWQTDGQGSIEIKLTKKDIGVWKFWEYEYQIKEIWIYYDSSSLNDFILINYDKSEPFIIEGKETYETIIVDNEHHISYAEYQNGYAEINDEIVELSKHEIEVILREKEEGYLFIGLKSNPLLDGRSYNLIHNFIENAKKNKLIDLENLKKFQFDIRKNKSIEILSRL
ncbi:protein kinase domain-containing protein [Tenacibaculum piscium]|uniref:protein kinase domain-containing protein n=1 Tax=Tenacibaculum piscium TaxID=1458515 RepID=UPI001F1C7CE0|nr:protein kinase [Tenacibaculum piscium]